MSLVGTYFDRISKPINLFLNFNSPLPKIWGREFYVPTYIKTRSSTLVKFSVPIQEKQE